MAPMAPPLVRTDKQRDAALQATQDKKNAQRTAREAAGTTNPSIVTALNTAREEAKNKGMDTTAGNLKDYSTFASSYKPPVPTPTPLTNPDGTTDADKLRMGKQNPMPTPTAPQTQADYQMGLQGSVETATKTLNETLTRERDAALQRTEALNSKLETGMKEQDPTRRATWDQEQTIIQSQLDAAESATGTLEADFSKRRSVVSELEKLLTEGNNLITSSRNAPVAMSVLGKSTSRTLQDVQARSGVLEAVVAGLDGNISQAHSIVNNARTAVAASWNDTLTYNTKYLKLVEDGQLRKDKIHDSYAEAQITLAETKLNNLQETSDYIQKLMISPESAQFLADAGVTLNDTVDEINEKMAKQTKTEEVQDVMNELKKEGYKNVPFGAGRDDLVELEVAGEKLYFIPPVVSSEIVGGFEVLKDTSGKVISSRALPTGGSGAGGKVDPISRTDAVAYGLPMSMIGMDEDAFLADIQGATPPQWFVDKAEGEARMSMEAETLKGLWGTFKGEVEKKFMGDDEEDDEPLFTE